jgi:hypothetical protein
MGNILAGWLNGTDPCDPTETNFTKDTTLTAQWTKYATISASISLKESIDLNFFIRNIAVGNASNYMVEYGKTDATETVNLNDWPYENDRYYFEVAKCPARGMTETYVFNVYYKETDDAEGTLIFTNAGNIDSIKAYCDWQIDRNADERLVDLCYAVLDYGGSAQKYFDPSIDPADLAYNRRNDPEWDNKMDEVRELAVKAYNETFDPKGKISNVDAYLNLENETGIWLYFTPAAKAGLKTSYFKVYDNDGDEYNDYKVTKSGSKFIVKINNIKAIDLNSWFTVTVERTEGVVETSYRYCPLVYAYRWRDYSPSVTDLCKSLYNYFLKARAYT